MKLPYFYPEDHTMESAFNDVTSGSGSPPMTGFLGVPGTGVSPHLDETCDNFMTVQVGETPWQMVTGSSHACDCFKTLSMSNQE